MDVIDVGSAKQLFVDETFVADSSGVELVMNTPYQSPDPVLVPETPWETSFGVYHTALQESDGRIRVWYNAHVGGQQAHVGYAESTDGVHFTKPQLRAVAGSTSTALNAALPGKIGGSSVWIDPRAPAEERYKNQSKVYDPDVSMQFHMHSSPDGLDWTFHHRIQFEQRGGWDTQSIIFWDQAIDRYVLYTRRWVARRHTTAEGNENYRTVRRLESDNLVNWDNQQTVMWPDEDDLATYDTGAPMDPSAPEKPHSRVPVDYYGATVFKYPDADGLYIMLANANWCWYEQGREVTTLRDDLEALREETEKEYGPSRFDARLAVSRDGVNFRRCGERCCFIGPGPEGSFSSRMVWAMPHPVVMGDELWIYYGGTNRDHDGHVDPAADGHLSGIGRAVMRLDGFVSADAGYGGGQIITPPVRFEGNELVLNFDGGGGGSVRVELQDAEGRLIDGYTESDASFVCGNSVQLPVSWGERRDVSSLAGKPLRIRFIMRDCKLYAFQFRNKVE